MESMQAEYTIRSRSVTPFPVLSSIWYLFTKEKKLLYQVSLFAPLIFAGIAFQLSTFSWIAVIVSTLLVVIAELFRSAAGEQIKKDPSLTPFQVSRITCFGTGLVAITSILSLIAYALVFIPPLVSMI